MSDSKQPPRSPEELQKELQAFFKDKFGTDAFAVPIGAVPSAGAPAPGSESPGSGSSGDESSAETIPDDVLEFSMRPREVKSHLDRFVIGQDEAKRTLAVAVCDHYNHVRRWHDSIASGREPERDDYVKQNVILLGPTGVGKTYLIRNLAELIGVPFVKGDSTKYSETGYVGGDVEDLVRELHRVAGGNALLAEHGIIFLDEIDKIATGESSSSRGPDPSGRGVQVALLKLMEDTEVPLRNPMDIGSQFQDLMGMRQGKTARHTLNTRHILFVVSGAFSGLSEIVSKRLLQQNIGFGSLAAETGLDADNLLSHATTRDFVDFGFEPEFIGRLPIRCALDDLSEDDLYEILHSSEGSILRQYRESFRGYGLEIAVDDPAMREFARRAAEEGTGARGLMTVLESSLRDFKFYLPGRDVQRFAVTKELVDDPSASLERILRDPAAAAADYEAIAVREWEDSFAAKRGVRLELDDEATNMATGVAAELGVPVGEHLDGTFDEHRDFLRKILETSGRDALPVTPHILSRPTEGVELWLTK